MGAKQVPIDQTAFALHTSRCDVEFHVCYGLTYFQRVKIVSACSVAMLGVKLKLFVRFRVYVICTPFYARFSGPLL